MRGSSGLHAKANESQPAPVSRQSMRAFIDALDRSGALRRIPQPVNREFEIAACLVEADDGPALQFDRVDRPFHAGDRQPAQFTRPVRGRAGR